MGANEIYRTHKVVTGYNLRIPFSDKELGHTTLPAGIYFYVLLHNGTVLTASNGAIAGKGKFALLP
jgi:hypothetical protein